jgi:putative NADH-flavin reductase
MKSKKQKQLKETVKRNNIYWTYITNSPNAIIAFGEKWEIPYAVSADTMLRINRKSKIKIIK